jgi:hypothetical protein
LPDGAQPDLRRRHLKDCSDRRINMLDPGGFGAVTIWKSLTIRSDHIEAGVLSGTNRLSSMPGRMTESCLKGSTSRGSGTGLNGVSVIAGKVYIIRCSIRHFINRSIWRTARAAGTPSSMTPSSPSMPAV